VPALIIPQRPDLGPRWIQVKSATEVQSKWSAEWRPSARR